MSGDGGAAFGAAHAGSYADSARRQVPGYADLHRIAALLLAERVPADGRVLVLGAGGGAELSALAEAHAGWRLVGVDPSADMLRTAAAAVAPHAGRVELVEGRIEAAPAGPFDGATCLLTLHFVPGEERLSTLTQLRERLRPGAPLVVAHLSFAQEEPARSLWLDRHLRFGGVDPTRAEASRQAMLTRLAVLSPADDEAALRAAGFTDVSLIYAGLSLRGWVAYA